MLYYLKMPEDIAEVYYNKSLNYIMQGNYKEAVHALLVAMKTIIKLHLNSLRVCNTSKVYALLALASIFRVTDSAVSAICSAASSFLIMSSTE